MPKKQKPEPIHPDEIAFHRALAETDGNDPTTWKVYADWLRDQGGNKFHLGEAIDEIMKNEPDIYSQTHEDRNLRNPQYILRQSKYYSPDHISIDFRMPFLHTVGKIPNHFSMQKDNLSKESAAKISGHLEKAGLTPVYGRDLIEKMKQQHPEHFRRGIPSRLAKKDLIPGGLADHKPDSSFNPKSIRKGIKVEKEHTSNPQVAKEIAKDHLSESSTYYDEMIKCIRTVFVPTE